MSTGDECGGGGGVGIDGLLSFSPPRSAFARKKNQPRKEWKAIYTVPQKKADPLFAYFHGLFVYVAWLGCLYKYERFSAPHWMSVVAGSHQTRQCRLALVATVLAICLPMVVL